MLIGVYGDNDGLENTPNSSPGCLLPPPKPRAGELLIRKHAKKLGVPVVAAHRAVLTQQLDHKRLPTLLHPGNARAQKILAEHMRSRAACFWATACGRGCSIRANYQSTTVHLPPALATGNLDIVTNAMVREVELDKRGKATGVVFIDKTTGKEHRAKARIVVLAASACETRAHPAQLEVARSSRKGSRTRAARSASTSWTPSARRSSGQIPALENLPPHNEDGAGGMHVYSPWWLYKEQLAGKLDFARGYHIEIGQRAAHAERRLDGAGCRASPAATAASSRRTCGATTARSSASPAAAR